MGREGLGEPSHRDAGLTPSKGEKEEKTSVGGSFDTTVRFSGKLGMVARSPWRRP